MPTTRPCEFSSKNCVIYIFFFLPPTVWLSHLCYDAYACPINHGRLQISTLWITKCYNGNYVMQLTLQSPPPQKAVQVLHNIGKSKEITNASTLYKVLIISVFAIIMVSETWKLNKEDEHWLFVVEMNNLRKILGVTRLDRINTIRQTLGIRRDYATLAMYKECCLLNLFGSSRTIPVLGEDVLNIGNTVWGKTANQDAYHPYQKRAEPPKTVKGQTGKALWIRSPHTVLASGWCGPLRLR